MYPASGFGVQRENESGPVDKSKTSELIKGAAIHAPINLLSRGHAARITPLFGRQGFACRVSMAKTDHADTCKQVPVRRKDKYAAAATGRDPGAGELNCFFSKTSQFGSASADLRCNCFSRSADSLVR